nr:hypothetical protein [Tanacetum cinerariifolium]
MSYLSDFEELNGGYVAFGGNPKGGKFDGKVDKGVLVGYSVSSKAFRNTDVDAAFRGKKTEFQGRKPESEVHVSPSSSAQTKKHDDKTKRERLKARVNAVDSPVPVVRQMSTNSTNTFSAAGPSNGADSPTHEKYSYVNTSLYPDDLNMPELEEITYSDDDKNVGAEADFTNLETTITISPIPTTRVHKDHHEEVYVCQPPRFEDPDYPDKVYKVVKALYGLHQDPRAWYETLANYLLENGFQMGKIDLTLFIKKQKGDILLVQIYVDDIIFGSTNKDLVNQKPDGIFISQDKYVAEILRKFRLTDRKSTSTHIDTEKPLLKHPDGEDVDVHTYGSMIGSLMYLTSSRPAIMFAAYSNSDYAGASLNRKSTIGGCQFLGCRFISWKCKKQIVVATSSTDPEAQVGDLSSHSTKYSSPAVTEKVFANMRRVGKEFFGVDTPLFEGMTVAQQEDDVADEGAARVNVDDVPAAGVANEGAADVNANDVLTAIDEPSIPSPTPPTQPPPQVGSNETA